MTLGPREARLRLYRLQHNQHYIYKCGLNWVENTFTMAPI
jgi:hypothetical protein